MPGKWDVIVIGGGHAGCEAALAAVRVGASVLVLTQNLDRVGHMACNCSVGGPAKGHLACELDALGGEQGAAADATHTHVRMLNTGKGPAVQALRAQVDKREYEQHMKECLEHTPGLRVLQSDVSRLLLAGDGRRVLGVRTAYGEELLARAVIVAVGTFLRAKVYYGRTAHDLGRAGDPSSLELGEFLAGLGFPVIRLKTGTVPRVALSSIDPAGLEPQPSERVATGFSWRGLDPGVRDAEHPCYTTRATAETCEIVRAHLDDSALASGMITGAGPRYCPSIEAKVLRFPEKRSHPVFLEIEGRTTDELYVQGLSNSLAPEVQSRVIRSVPGLEHAVILRYGYAVEYDAYDSRRLHPTLASETIEGLYLAGQVNGTSGYEEAAIQGLVAGANAALFASGGGRELRIGRLEGYAGILLSDLADLGVDEPYRMMTARAANRLELRCSNAPDRLTPLGRGLGLVGNEQWRCFEQRLEALELATGWVSAAHADRELLRAWPGGRWGPVPTKGTPLASLIERPGLEIMPLLALAGAPTRVLRMASRPQVLPELWARFRYRGYVERERLRLHGTSSPSFEGLIFAEVPGLKAEAVERLNRHQPRDLAEARQLRGLTAADLDALQLWCGKRDRQRRRGSPQGGSPDVSRETGGRGQNG